jgi:purine nucleosidase
MQRLIIDTDPGIDDAHAVLMALAHPNARVEAITTVNGNVDVDHTTRNAGIILEAAGADVPIYRGCAAPLVAGRLDAAHVHGSDGLGDAGFAPSRHQPRGEPAPVALVRLADAAPGELTLVAIGPLTNLAVALKLDPALPLKYQRLVIMAGAIHGRGNTANLSAEFNVFADPEAAHVVFETWPRLTMLSWETTLAHGFAPEVFERFFALGTPRAEFFRRSNAKIIAHHLEVMRRTVLYAPDGLAMAVALEPEIVRRSEVHAVSVELQGKYTRGQTTVDWMDRGGKPANVEIILEVNQPRFIELMEAGLR